jgi:hypothetical protein
VPKVNLSGAYGISTPPPAAAIAHHPERVQRYSRGLMILWGARLAVVAVLLFVLYAFHVI